MGFAGARADAKAAWALAAVRRSGGLPPFPRLQAPPL